MWLIWFFVLEAVVIVTGNVTVLVIFTRTPVLRKRKHFLLVSLAVADLLVGLISVPMYVRLSLARYTIIIRKIYSIQDILFGTASVFGLTAVAIERAYAVYFPYKHRTLWKGVYVIGIAVIWVMAACIAFASTYLDRLLWVCAVMIPLAVSLAIIVVSYLLIWVKINCMTSVQGHAIRGRDNSLTITLLIVTVISLIAWIPFQVITVYAELCPECFFGKYILVGTTKFLHYCNSLVNPIIYALRMPQFKSAFLYRIRNCVTCNKNQESVHENRINALRINCINNEGRHDNDADNHVSDEEDHCDRPNTNRTDDSHHDNDVDNHVSDEEDHCDRPNTNRTDDSHHDNDVDNHVSDEEDHCDRPNTNRTNGGHHDNDVDNLVSDEEDHCDRPNTNRTDDSHHDNDVDNLLSDEEDHCDRPNTNRTSDRHYDRHHDLETANHHVNAVYYDNVLVTSKLVLSS